MRRERFPAGADAPVRLARAVMHTGVANWRFPLKSVVGKTLPTFPTHAQPVIVRIWQEAHAFPGHFVDNGPGVLVMWPQMVWINLIILP